MNGQPDRKWPWFHQVQEAAVSVLGIAILVTMTVRNSWPPLGVAAALVCVGSLSASALLRYLLGRWEAENGTGRR
jgi:hypothetical protein